MTLAATTATETLVLKHHYPYSCEQVYAAWSDPQALGQWFGPHSHQCKVEQFNLSEGGDYKIRMIPISEDTDCGGDPTADSVCAGQFVQIAPNEKIVMTFGWIENAPDIGETLLTVEFIENNGGTDLVMTHERLPDEALRNAHASGWQGSMECLEEYLQG